MNEYYSASAAVSPFTAILWCLYPIAVLVIIELLLGGGFDDDNDDQDGGMLIPAYSRSEAWIFWLNFNLWKNFSKLTNNIDTTHISLIILTIIMVSSLSWLVLRTLKEGRKALTEMNKDRS